MMALTSFRELASVLLFLSGAAVAVFVTGKHDVAAMVAVAVGGGLGLLISRPTSWPGWLPVGLALLYVACCGAALLPADPQVLPAWRNGAAEMVKLADSFGAMPPHVLFWLLVLAATIAAGWFLLAAPLGTPQLRIFLHCVAGVVAGYAVVSIVQAHTDWKYPFSGGANFGLLPNRNHTATLLVVGSIVSFGLMQWEVARGHRVGAVLAALWGAPALAALLFFSTSRAGVVFLVVGFVLWAVGATGTALKRSTTLGAAGVLAAFLLALFVFGGSTVRDRLGKLWGDVMVMEEGDGEARDVDFRQPVFRDTWHMIGDAPLTGQGLGHFEFVFPHYREASLTSSRVLHPESDWLMVAAESGVPAVVALWGLVAWFFVRCWRGRQESGGLLRWTVASAIGAALAHGMIDVPWHRPALGWFLLIVGLVSVPAGRSSLRGPVIWRGLQVLLGLGLLVAAAYMGRASATYRPPLFYRWDGYTAELKALLDARKFDDGEFVAREAIRDFPLQHQAYYWRAAFLRMFEGTDVEMKQDLAVGRFVEPVLPRVAAEQAQIWEGISDRAEAESRAEAISRAQRIDQRSGEGKSALGQLEIALRLAQQRLGVQSELRQLVQSQPVLLAHWLRHADASLADAQLAEMGVSTPGFFDSLPEEARLPLLDRWIALPSAAGAVGYMETRNAEGTGAYWRQLAIYYAKAGDKARAVGIVAQAEGVPLDSSLPEGEFARQLAALQEQGNEVAVRRLLKEAAEAEKADPDKLRVALASYAAAGDWEMAWKAASRLVTATKNRQ
jgi:hypothetical protein